MTYETPPMKVLREYAERDKPDTDILRSKIKAANSTASLKVAVLEVLDVIDGKA